MSDLHGMFQDYCEMLDKINFSNNDSLYILGDICDRGPDTAKLYLDIISRNNVYCIRGNHEEMLLDALPTNFGYLRKLKENPEESVAKMLEPLTSAEKEKFVNAIGKITFKRIREENMSLMEFAKISNDPEKMKELMRCIDGKTVDEIIELAQ